MRQDVIDRFWGKVAKGPGCWLWQASVNEDGYGQLSVDGKVHRAHRLAWIIEHGDIPVGGQIRQRCQNRGCCRPDHLELRVIKVDDLTQRAHEARAKAVKNLGFVEKRGTKSFRLGVYIGRDPTTRRKKYERITFIAQRVETAEEEAVERLAELVLDRASGRSLTNPGFSFGEVLDLWFSHVVTELEELTADSYRGYLAHVPGWLRDVPVEKVTTEHLEELYRQLRTNGNRRTGDPLSIKYVRGGVHLVISNALQMARRRKWIRHSPAADVEWPNPKKVKRARRRPTPTPMPGARSIMTLARERHGLAMEVFLRVTAAAGGRRGEVHGLRWQYIDFDTGLLEFADTIVRTTAGRQRGGPRLKHRGWTVKPSTKSDRPRFVKIGPATLALLRQLYDEMFERAVAFGAELARDAFVFSDAPDGSDFWIPRTTWDRYARLCRELSLPTTRLHDLRAMMSTELINRGLPVPAVGGRLGHAYSSHTYVTLDVYTGRDKHYDDIAAQMMDDMLDGKID